MGSPEQVQAVLENLETAPIPAAEKALLAFVDKLNHRSAEVGQADIALLKEAGWTDEAIYDAVTVCALFNFYNRWIDGTGVQGMSPDLYRQSGQRLAAHGYAPPEETPSGPPEDSEG